MGTNAALDLDTGPAPGSAHAEGLGPAEGVPAEGVWAVFYDDSSGLALYPTAESACRAAAGTCRQVAFVPFGQDFITIGGGFAFAAHPPGRPTGWQPIPGTPEAGSPGGGPRASRPRPGGRAPSGWPPGAGRG